MNRTFPFLLVFALLVVFPTFGQQEKEPPVTLSRTENGFTFEKVVDVPGVSKDELYKRIKQWVITNIKSSELNTFDDADKNTISTTILFPLIKNQGKTSIIDFKFVISLKDNKYKLSANQFRLHVTLINATETTDFHKLKGFFTNRHQTEEYEDFDAKFTAILTSIQKSAENKADNW